MGVFSCPLRISSLDNRRSREIEATVDTAATYTMLPIDVLNELGISPTRKGIFEMADGHREELDIGELRITINGASAVSPVIIRNGGGSALARGCDTGNTAPCGRSSWTEIGANPRPLVLTRPRPWSLPHVRPTQTIIWVVFGTTQGRCNYMSVA